MSASAADAKRVARARLGAVRDAIPPSTRRALSETICAHIVSARAWSRASVVALYVPHGSEVDVLPLATVAASQDRLLAIPRCVSDTEMVFDQVSLDVLGALVPGRFGIPCAPLECVVEPSVDALVLVPCLGADTGGNRLGSGRGFYDRYLYGRACALVAVTFAALVDAVGDGGLPVEPHDVAVDAIVTELGWSDRRA